jgi:hypothetical protein
MDMACELNDMELDAVSGGRYAPSYAPKYDFREVTIALGNVSTGNITGGSGNITLTGGSNNSVSFA